MAPKNGDHGEESAHDQSPDHQATPTRRQLLKTTPAFVSIPVLSTPIRAGEETVRVPKARSAEGVELWREVPKTWFDHVQREKKVIRSFQSQLSDREGVGGISSVRSFERFGGQRGLQIKIEIDESKFTGTIPERYDDIPVTVKDIPEQEPLGCYNDQNFDSMPGGVFIDGEPLGQRFGTSGYTVTYNGSTYMITASHIFGGCGYSDSINIGEPAYQYSREFGDVLGYDENEDWAFVEVDSNSVSLDTSIKPPSTPRYSVEGYADEWEVAWRVTSSTDSCKLMGITSGLQHNCDTLSKDNNDGPNCWDYSGEGVTTAVPDDIASGDSGGPVFFLDSNNNAYVIHLTSVGVGLAGTTRQSCLGNTYAEFLRSKGIAAYQLCGSGICPA